MAPPRRQVAERALPLLGGARGPAAVKVSALGGGERRPGGAAESGGEASVVLGGQGRRVRASRLLAGRPRRRPPCRRQTRVRRRATAGR